MAGISPGVLRGERSPRPGAAGCAGAGGGFVQGDPPLPPSGTRGMSPAPPFPWQQRWHPEHLEQSSPASRDVISRCPGNPASAAGRARGAPGAAAPKRGEGRGARAVPGLCPRGPWVAAATWWGQAGGPRGCVFGTRGGRRGTWPGSGSASCSGARRLGGGRGEAAQGRGAHPVPYPVSHPIAAGLVGSVFLNGEKPEETEKKGSGSMAIPFCDHRRAPACSQVRSSGLREGTGAAPAPVATPPPEPQAGWTGRKLEPVVLPPPPLCGAPAQ